MADGFFEKIKKKKGVLLLAIGLCIGIVLVLTENRGASDEPASNHAEYIEKYTDDAEKKLEELINRINGVSDAHVMIILESGSEYVYASDGSEASEKHVVVNDELVYVKEYLPKIKGVAIVCKGGNDAVINAKVTKLVSSVLGLYTTHVYVTE